MLLMTSSGLVPCSESVNLPIPGQPQQAGLNDWPLEAEVGQEARPQQRRQLADQLPSLLSFFFQKHQPEIQLELQPAIVIDHFPLFFAKVYWYCLLEITLELFLEFPDILIEERQVMTGERLSPFPPPSTSQISSVWWRKVRRWGWKYFPPLFC